MKLVFVSNPKSGSALNKSKILNKCHGAGIEIEAWVTVKPGFERRLAPHIRAGKIIAAIGGDGTIGSVAGQVVGTMATLAPLPGGTFNHFTKDLGISQDIGIALENLKTAPVRRIDIGRVNDTYFINNSSIGIYPAMLRDRNDSESKLGKWPAAIVASFRALVRLRTYTIDIDGETITTPFVFVGNNHYELDRLGGASRESLDEGVLTVLIAKTRSRATLLKIALLALIGRVKDLPEFTQYDTTKLTISSRRRHLSVSHDGEVTKSVPPIRYTIEARKLRVFGGPLTK